MPLLKFAGTIHEVWQLFMRNFGIYIAIPFVTGPTTRGRAITTYSLEKNAIKCSDSNAYDMASAMTQVRSIRPLIKVKWAWIRLWSDLSYRSDLWPDFPDQIELWSDLNQTMAQTILPSNCCLDPAILVWEHMGLRSSGSDHSSIWVWTSTWERHHHVNVVDMSTPMNVLFLFKFSLSISAEKKFNFHRKS